MWNFHFGDYPPFNNNTHCNSHPINPPVTWPKPFPYNMYNKYNICIAQPIYFCHLSIIFNIRFLWLFSMESMESMDSKYGRCKEQRTNKCNILCIYIDHLILFTKYTPWIWDYNLVLVSVLIVCRLLVIVTHTNNQIIGAKNEWFWPQIWLENFLFSFLK